MKLNPIYRNDLRFRLTSPRAISLFTIYLSLLGVLAMLALPPEVGRIDELRQEGLLRVMLIIQMVLVAYFTSAAACGEIAMDGEKSAWDLATAPFPSWVIARGKVAVSLAFAATMMLAGVPIVTMIAAIRGETLGPIARAPVVGLPFAMGMGALGALYGASFDSDFARSFVHWLTLVTLVAASTALPSPWNLISPVRALTVAAQGLRADILLVAAAYLLLAVAAAAALRARIDTIRREAEAK